MSLTPLGATFLHTKKQLAVVALFVLLVATLLLVTVTTKSNASKESSESRPVNAKKSCCSDDINKHLLAASYYSVKDNYRSNLMLNNKGPDPVEVRPTLFALNGSRIDAPSVIVPGESF